VSTSGGWTPLERETCATGEAASSPVGLALHLATILWGTAVGSEVSVAIDRDNRGARHCYSTCYFQLEFRYEVALTIRGSEELSLPKTLAKPSKARGGP